MGTAAIQGELWGAHAEDWANIAEPTTRPLWQAIADTAEMGPGCLVLDLGCGGGGAGALYAETGASVTGLDASANLIDIARRRVPDGRFEVGDLVSLPFPSGSFDVVTACNSVQFVDDRPSALREIHRVLAPGGRFAIGMWCEPDRCEASVLFAALMEVTPPPPNPEPSLSARENLTQLLNSNGFEIEQEGEVECPFEFESADQAWQGFRSAGMMVGAARVAGEETLRATIQSAIRPFEDSSGRIRMSNWFRYVVCKEGATSGL